MLPKTNRLVNRSDFQTLFRSGQKWQGKFFIGIFKEQPIPDSLFGFVISNKVSPRAVARNQARRYLRESFRLLLPKIKAGLKVVLIAKKEILEADFTSIDLNVKAFLKENKLINE